MKKFIIVPMVPDHRYGEIFPHIKNLDDLRSLYFDDALFYCPFEIFLDYLSTHKRKLYSCRGKFSEAKAEYGFETDEEVAQLTAQRIFDLSLAEDLDVSVIACTGSNDITILFEAFHTISNLYPNVEMEVLSAPVNTPFEDITVYKIFEDKDIPNLFHHAILVNVEKFKDKVNLRQNPEKLKEIERININLVEPIHNN